MTDYQFVDDDLDDDDFDDADALRDEVEALRAENAALKQQQQPKPQPAKEQPTGMSEAEYYAKLDAAQSPAEVMAISTQFRVERGVDRPDIPEEDKARAYAAMVGRLAEAENGMSGGDFEALSRQAWAEYRAEIGES